jgi:hypothetical protein
VCAIFDNAILDSELVDMTTATAATDACNDLKPCFSILGRYAPAVRKIRLGAPVNMAESSHCGRVGALRQCRDAIRDIDHSIVSIYFPIDLGLDNGPARRDRPQPTDVRLLVRQIV